MPKFKKKNKFGRIGGDHGTVLSSAKSFVAALQRCVSLSNITLGHIDGRFGVGRGKPRVKLTSMDGFLQLRISNAGAQLVRVFTNEASKAIEEIEQAAVANGFEFEIDKRQR